MFRWILRAVTALRPRHQFFGNPVHPLRKRSTGLYAQPLEDRLTPAAVAPGMSWTDGSSGYPYPSTPVATTVTLYNSGATWLEVSGGNGHVTVSPGSPPSSTLPTINTSGGNGIGTGYGSGSGMGSGMGSGSGTSAGGGMGSGSGTGAGSGTGIGSGTGMPGFPTVSSANYAFQVYGSIGPGSGDVTWSGAADRLTIRATGDVDPVSIAGDVTIDADWTISDVTGKTVTARAGKSVGDVTASDDVGTVSAGTSVGKVTAVDDIGNVSAGTSVGVVSAGGEVSTVSAGQSTSSVTAGGWLGSVSAGLDVGGSISAGLWIGGAYAPGAVESSWYYTTYYRGVSAGRDVVGAVTAGRGIVEVSAGRHVLGSVTAGDGDVWRVHAGGGGIYVPGATMMDGTWVPYAPGRVAEAVTASRDVYTVDTTGNVIGKVTAQGGFVYAVNAGDSVTGGVTAETDIGRVVARDSEPNWRPAGSSAAAFGYGATLGAGVIAKIGDVKVRVEAKTGDVNGPVSAGENVTAKVTAAGDVRSVSAGRHISGDVTAGRDVETVFAASPIMATPGAPMVMDGDVTGKVTAGRDIGTVRAGRDVKNDITAGRDIETVRAGRNIGTGIQNPTYEDPVEIEATVGQIRRVVAQGTISAKITAGTHVGDPLHWPADDQIIRGDEFVGPIYMAGLWPAISYQGYADPAAFFAHTGVVSGGDLMAKIDAGGDVRLVSSGGVAKVQIDAGRHVGAVGGRVAVRGEIAAAGSVGGVWSGLSYPYALATIGNISAKVTAGGYVGSVGAWGGNVEGTVTAGTDVGSVSATGNVKATVTAGSDVGSVRADNGYVDGNVTATAGDVGQVMAGTTITSRITAGDDIWGVVSGTSSGGGITGSIKAGDDIGEVLAHGTGGIAGRPAGLARPENPTSLAGDELDGPLWVIDAAQDQYQPLTLPADRPERPELPSGGTIEAAITAQAGHIGTVTAFGTVKGGITAAKTIGHATSGAYPGTGVWAAGTIESSVTAGAGDLGVRSWGEIKGNVTAAGDLAAWAYGDLRGDLKSGDGSIFAGSWDDLTGEVDAKNWADVRAFNDIGEVSAAPAAPAATKTVTSESDAARVWAGRYETSAVKADKYAAVYATKGVLVAQGSIQSNTEDAYVQAKEEDIILSGGSPLSGGVNAKDQVWLQAGRNIEADPVQSREASVVIDAGGAVNKLKGTAKQNMWVSARDGDAKIEVATEDGWAYVWAAQKIQGKVTAKQTVSATAYTDIDAELKSTEDGAEIWAGNDLKGQVTGAQWVDVEAGGTVSATVVAGTGRWYGDAVIRAGIDVTGNVTVSGKADVAAQGSVRANVSATEGGVEVVANVDVAGNMTAKSTVEVTAGGTFVGSAVADEEVEVEATDSVNATIQSAKSGVSVWTGGSLRGQITAFKDAIVESYGIIDAPITAEETASVVGKGNITGNISAKWVADVRSSEGEVTGTVTTSMGKADRLGNPESPTRKRLAKIDAELQALVANPGANDATTTDLQTEKEILTLPDLQTNYQHIDPARVRSMIADGLATEYDGPKYEGEPTKGYVVISDVVGRSGYSMVLEPMKDTTTYYGDPYGGGVTEHILPMSLLGRDDIATAVQYYRVVKRYDVAQLATSIEPAAYIGTKRSDVWVKSMVEAAALAAALETIETVLTVAEFALHLVPLAGAVDDFIKGDYWEAGISLAGDATMLLGLGAAIKGAKCINSGSKLIKFASRASATIEGGIVATRLGQGFHALNSPTSLSHFLAG